MLGLNQEGMRFRTPRTEVGSAQAGQETGKSDREPVGTADNADARTFRVLEMSNMRSNLTNIILSFELAVVVIELGDYDSRPVSHRHSNQSPKAAKCNGLAELKADSAQNKENLATYTWQEQDTISVKGETKTQELFRVRVGPDGKPQKTAMNTNQPREQSKQADTGRRGRINGRVITERLDGHYLKAGRESHSGVQIGSYMDSASDVVKIAVQFAKLPDGTNHISTMSVDGVSKHLKVLVENSNYKKL
jgi:hypothetical protein